jgi:tRNA 2-thiouridine synthesizing protein A
MIMDTQELAGLTVAKKVDARGTACPGPLLEAKRSIAAVPVGGIMEVLSSDDSTKRDLPLWARKVGHEYLGSLDEAGYSRIFVKKGK